MVASSAARSLPTSCITSSAAPNGGETSGRNARTWNDREAEGQVSNLPLHSVRRRPRERVARQVIQGFSELRLCRRGRKMSLSSLPAYRRQTRSCALCILLFRTSTGADTTEQLSFDDEW